MGPLLERLAGTGGLADGVAEDAAGLAVLSEQLESRSATAKPELSAALLREARKIDGFVRPEALAALLAVVEDPRGGVRSNGFYITAVLELMTTRLKRDVLDALERGPVEQSRAEARQLMYTGRTNQIKTLACAWLDLAFAAGTLTGKKDLSG